MAERTTTKDRLPPQVVEVEQAVLGAMLLDKEAIGKAVEVLDESCFYKSSHAKIFSAMVSLYDRNEPVDLITLPQELKKRLELEEVGGIPYINDLATSVALQQISSITPE